MSRANLNKDPDEVAAMFDGVAKRYDLVNDLLSLGRTKAWRRAATKIIAPQPGMVILDLAAGPGSSSEPLFKAGATVFATDFSEGMLAQGRKARPYLNFSKANALSALQCTRQALTVRSVCTCTRLRTASLTWSMAS